MSKRRSENGQMRREEYEAASDDDLSQETGGGFDGGFERAPEAAIARRKIVTARVGAKRPAPAPTPVAAAVTSEAPKTNAFVGFQGLAAPEPPARANPFAGFSGLTTASPAPPSAALSFGQAVPTLTPASKTSPTTYQEAIEVLNKEFLAFVNQQLQQNPSSDWSAAVQDYAQHAQGIGAKFASTKPVAGSVAASAVAAARPASATSATNKEASPAASGFSFGAGKAPAASTNGFSFNVTPAAKPTAVSGGFSFGSPSTATATASSSSTDTTDKPASKPASSLFSFGAKPAEEKAIPAFSFGPTKPNETGEKPKPTTGGGFSFVSAAPAAAPASGAGGFSFGGVAKPATAAPQPSGGFSFSLSTTPAASTSAPTASGAREGEDEDEENIGREEATVILKSDNADDDCVFEAEKAKVIEFKKDEKRWADKGTHPLQVLVNKTTKNARILVRNEIGKIVLNSALYKGLAIKPHEAKGKKTGALLALQVDTTITQFILKVNSEKVDAFLSALENATPK